MNNKRLVLTAAAIIILTGIIYKAGFGNHLMEERREFVQIESTAIREIETQENEVQEIETQENEAIEQQPGMKTDKSVYRLEARQYDETVYDKELQERALSYIENTPIDPNLEFDIKYVLEREWLKKISIFCIYNLEDETAIINNYLKEQGISKTIPDNIAYHNGYPFIKYYEDDTSGKVAFVATLSGGERLSTYVYCGSAYIEDFKKEGSYNYDYDPKGKLLSEKFYNNSGEEEVAISYTYNINVPFPIITKYDNSMGEEDFYHLNECFNIGQRFWVYDGLIEYDDNGRWVKYNGDIYNDYSSGSGIESYNTPVYSEEGQLEKVIETLRGSRYQDNPDEWIEDGSIEFKYDDSDRLIEVEYEGFSGNHGSSGNSGTISYDENGRVVHIDSFHSSGDYHRFYLYQNNENCPFVIFAIGGMPYSGDGYDDYRISFGMDFEAWLFLDE